MPGTDPISAIVDQLAAHAEQLTRLDTCHADHHAAVSARLAELTGQTAALGHVVEEHAAALTRLTAPSQTGPDGDSYHPEPVPAWWKLAADDRPEREWFARQVGGQWADNILFDEICRVTNLVPPRGLDREAIDEVGG